MKEDIITLGHGSGAGLTHELIADVFHKEFNLPSLDDSARISNRMVVSTDSFVVKPLFFAGGCIGTLSVNGTINDVSMSGSKPLYLLASFIIEEGFSIKDLKKIVQSMQQSAEESQVRIIAGDTKVVKRGECDGIYITTTGIGILPEDVNLSATNIQIGDEILVNGTLGDHSAAIINARQKLMLDPMPASDCAPLYGIVQFLLRTGKLKFARDATRGGIATILNEIYRETKLGIIIEEDLVPIKNTTKVLCDLLGLDVLYLANEGKLISFVSAMTQEMIGELKKQKYAEGAAVIGKVTDEVDGVYLRNSIGSLRPLRMLASDPLPRIC